MNKDKIKNSESDLNVDAYEEKAVNRSKMARNIAIGAAAVGGVGVAATAAASTINPNPDIIEEFNDELTMEDITDGATVSEAPAPEVEVVHVTQPAPAPAAAPVEEPQIVWEETEEIYLNDEKLMSVETGTVDGQKFSLIDVDNDNLADIIGIDMNNNGAIEENEFFEADPSHRLAMGNETQHTTRTNYITGLDDIMAYENAEQQRFNEEVIHNDFEDEKTGERYYGDYAENNPDYNPNAHYTAEMHLPAESSECNYEENTVTEDYAMNEEDTPDQDTFDMGGEESFIG